MNSDLTEIVWKKSAINFTKLMCYQSQKKKKLVQIFIYYGVKMILFFMNKMGFIVTHSLDVSIRVLSLKNAKLRVGGDHRPHLSHTREG